MLLYFLYCARCLVFRSFLFVWLLSFLMNIDTSHDWSTAVTSHAAVNSDARSIQISSQNIRIRR